MFGWLIRLFSKSRVKPADTLRAHWDDASVEELVEATTGGTVPAPEVAGPTARAQTFAERMAEAAAAATANRRGFGTVATFTAEDRYGGCVPAGVKLIGSMICSAGMPGGSRYFDTSNFLLVSDDDIVKHADKMLKLWPGDVVKALTAYVKATMPAELVDEGRLVKYAEFLLHDRPQVVRELLIKGLQAACPRKPPKGIKYDF